MQMKLAWLPLTVVTCLLAVGSALAADLGEVRQHHVAELELTGPSFGPRDAPSRDIELVVAFRHESGAPTVAVHGFWDGDGRGGAGGNVFKVRFRPTRPGRWQVVKTDSNRDRLRGQHEGDTLRCTASSHPGSWIVDGRWYRRSDGSHPYIVGNTHYTFLSRRNNRGDVASDPVEDIKTNARYYKKLRFSLAGGRYPDPKLKPFLDDEGRQTDDGRFSFRPNPGWFFQRVDPVIACGHREDLVCDLILCGPDTRGNRSTLQGDPRPWLGYIAARYGAYPNVWVCLSNEWNIKTIRYSAKEIRAAGDFISGVLPYPTPVSVHGNAGPWNKQLNGDWHDHAIIQDKIRTLDRAADAARRSFVLGGGKPVVNDENAYQGGGDRFSKEDTIEGCLGTFLGGGYPTTGYKPGAKVGHYFWGGFDPDEHTASKHLVYLRNYIDREIDLGILRPMPLAEAPFSGTAEPFRLLAAPGREYVLGSNRKLQGIKVDLPTGRWRVAQVDLMNMTTKTLAEGAADSFTFDTPDSRAVLTHLKRSSPPETSATDRRDRRGE